MKDDDPIFHLAIPCVDLDDAYEFYIEGLGCELGRRYDDRITVKFFDHQVVCHLSDEEDIDEDPGMYPRHFGMTFAHQKQFEEVLESAREADLPFFQEPFSRFKGEQEEHHAFFLQDPSNNLLEFKYYHDPDMRY